MASPTIATRAEGQAPELGVQDGQALRDLGHPRLFRRRQGRAAAYEAEVQALQQPHLVALQA